ncbi:hypothetical protein X471_00764 [Bartonella bacilliformis str. Heidi Mejia]|uniref:hypothetical protein n=1 Tax=Bartonella bacilliformis TaxID=774 RepID=UPI00044E6108|nr:hypothetical protein [Bartonella bacilliformis]EYS91594.1 hypothetical protein X471_00764 [Bartonella bacilliformis str. Heidi Mejia]KEG16110.1 hypothetical protein H707_01259 [Bartonella bacilliformis Hosp800-02]KEG16206.1 hypothetical protein H707_01255 [Bartonella bacilliformis Hosp800-02]KEG24882.1 hypothetical protein H706_00196 [Bartonella bacilliformis CAR600-02]
MGGIAFLILLFMGVGGAGVLWKNFKTVLDSLKEESFSEEVVSNEASFTAEAVSTTVEVLSTFV